MGSIWKMGSSSRREISSRGNARLFDVYHCSEKNSYPARGRFHDVGMFLSQNGFSKNDPEVSGSGRGAPPTYQGPYLTHWGKQIENPIKIQKHNYQLEILFQKGILHFEMGFSISSGFVKFFDFQLWFSLHSVLF